MQLTLLTRSWDGFSLFKTIHKFRITVESFSVAAVVVATVNLRADNLGGHLGTSTDEKS
jgi:hypothetical protein